MKRIFKFSVDNIWHEARIVIGRSRAEGYNCRGYVAFSDTRPLRYRRILRAIAYAALIQAAA